MLLTYAVVGIVTGCLYALTASGLVVTYTTSGIFNFAHGAIGMFMAFTYWQLSVAWGWPAPVAMLVVLLVLAPLAGALIERVVIRPLYGASLSVSLVVTLGLLLGLLGAADAFWDPGVTRNLPAIFGSSEIHLFGVAVSYYDLMVLAISVAVAAGWLLFTRTRLGLTMKAVVDDRDLTARAGASPYRTAQLSWAMGASLAALAGILIAPLQQFDQFNLTMLVVVGYAAAVVGRLKSLPLTAAGAFALGLAQSYAVGYLPVTVLANLNPVLPMILLFAALLFLKQDRLAAARPVARRNRKTMGLGPSIVMGAVFVVAAGLVTQILSPGNLLIFGQGVVLGVVMLSLVLLSGYGGQVSLCQMTLAGFGSFFMGKTLGGGSLLGMIAAVVGPAAVGAVLAITVVRLRGIYLALATLAFAAAMDSLFFNKALGYGGVLHVGRFPMHSQDGFVIEVAVVFAAVAVGVLALKRGPMGRLLSALNDSESACASIGMSVTATKVAAFTLAAGIAGLGGALYGGLQGDVGPNDFQMLTSLILLLTITLGGIDTVAGAFAAAMFYSLQPVIQQHIHINSITFLMVGLGAVSLGRNPGGIAGQISDAVEQIRALADRFRPAPTTRPAPAFDVATDVMIPEERLVSR
ncbi:MAG TPA: ABC transporter permease [Acidimicrobiales bacterium]|nr:ABC transporter permease [Acidimicrobiales bacterium]